MLELGRLQLAWWRPLLRYRPASERVELRLVHPRHPPIHPDLRRRWLSRSYAAGLSAPPRAWRWWWLRGRSLRGNSHICFARSLLSAPERRHLTATVGSLHPDGGRSGYILDAQTCGNLIRPAAVPPPHAGYNTSRQNLGACYETLLRSRQFRNVSLSQYKMQDAAQAALALCRECA